MHPKPQKLGNTLLAVVNCRTHSRAVITMLMVASVCCAHCENEVIFERLVLYAKIIQLGNFEIECSPPVERTSQGHGTENGINYHLFTTPNTSFMAYGDKLYVNGRLVKDVRAGQNLRFFNGELSDDKGRAVVVTDNLFGEAEGPVVSFRYRQVALKFVGHDGPGGGGEEYLAENFWICTSSYRCFRIWDGQFVLWGINYGRVKNSVLVDLRKKVIQIDENPGQALELGPPVFANGP